ncbi:hypothetical protein BDW74DRAFT_36939 [Aspergillus multicolor]|uniref:uncharacterized protein n=1 Tax=Aspergillus multicolor TaxID=41759 RepID=UPI003CCDA2D5
MFRMRLGILTVSFFYISSNRCRGNPSGLVGFSSGVQQSLWVCSRGKGENAKCSFQCILFPPFPSDILLLMMSFFSRLLRCTEDVASSISLLAPASPIAS